MPHQTPQENENMSLVEEMVATNGNGTAAKGERKPLKENTNIVGRSLGHPDLKLQILKTKSSAAKEQIPHANVVKFSKISSEARPGSKGQETEKTVYQDDYGGVSSTDGSLRNTVNRLAINGYRRSSENDIIPETQITSIASNGTTNGIASKTLKKGATNGATRNGTPTTDQAEKETQQILAIHTRLEEMTCLKPRPEINELFGKLVGICVQTLPRVVTEKIMTDTRITNILPSLRGIASTAECHLESHWASLVISASSPPTTPAISTNSSCSPFPSPSRSLTPSPTPSHSPSPCSSHVSLTSDDEEDQAQRGEDETFTRLKTFPYYQNYTDLARMELSALIPLLPSQTAPRKIAFIGSGPLPLTSLCLSHLLRERDQVRLRHENGDRENVKLEILNIDNDARAIVQSSTLCTLLGRHALGMTFAHEPAGSPTRDLSTFDVVFLAALVGSTQEAKEEVLLKVVGQMRKGALVVVRTSHGLRAVLYPEFEFATEGVLEVVEILGVVHPFSHVVNSIVIGRVR